MEYVNNAIEMQGHFEQEGNNDTLWDTAGDTTKTKAELPRLAMAPYAMLEWLVQANRTPNELRLWTENKKKDNSNFQKYYCGLFKTFVMAAGQVNAFDKKRSMLVLGAEPVTATDEGFRNWVEHRLDATVGAKPQNIAPAMADPQ